MNTLWQHPYVNVFRHFEVSQWKKSAKEGDVTTCMDKQAKCTVYKISGVIPANNYIQLPKTGSQSIGLTGRYVYIAFKPVPERFFVAHLDIASADGLIIRISFSNLFKEFKSTSTWLQFPFIVTAAHNTVEYQTSVNAKHVAPGPSPSTTRWTLLVLDLQYILSIYLNRVYSHVKTVRMCANTYIKGVYTSDNYYEPGITQEECKRLRLVEKGVGPLPREMSFPLSKSENWHEKYDLIRFPCDSNKTPLDSLHKLSMSGSSHRHMRTSPSKKVPSVTVPASTSESSVSKVTSKRSVKFHKKRVSDERQLPEVGLDEPCVLHERNVQEYEPKEVHVITKSSKQPLHHKTKKTESVMQSEPEFRQRMTFPTKVPSSDVNRSNYKSLQPDPILKLKKVIGFGGGSMNQAIWTQNCSFIVYPCHALVIAVHIATGRQRFFIGHTDKVSCISMNRDSTLLASGQTGQNSGIRIWNYKTADCLSIFKVNAMLLFSVSFSDSGSILAVAGRDAHSKSLIAVWNTSRVLKGGEVNLVAKAHTEVDILKLKVSPADEARMVSCGRNNIRLWRLKDNSLRSAAVPLGEHHTMDFTDICWDYQPTASADLRRNTADEVKVYACSKTGHIFDIDHKRMVIADVHRLLPRKKDGEKQTMTSGAGITLHSIYANDTFCVTGSSDGFLRVWPLDFKHIYLEAEHDGPVSVVQMSDDGLKILAGTSTGNLGVLDVTTRSHHNVIRSHSDRILHFSQDVFRRHFATVSADHTIRVWGLETGQQLYDFYSPQECPTNICYHPSKQLFSVGFDNGAVRVFDIQATSLTADHRSHKGSITGLAFTPDGSKMFSSGADGTLCSYDSTDETYPVIRLLGGIVAKGSRYGPDALTVSPHGHFVAFIGPQSFTVTIVSSKTLDEVIRIDVTTVTAPVDAARGLIDTALRVYYTPTNTNHLIVTTENSRLLKFDAPTGKLMAEIGNIHREPCSSLDISRSGQHLVTAGDKVLKVWDYRMRLDLNFQVFIGQSEGASKIAFTPTYNEIISCGEAIFIWQFLGDSNSAEESSQSVDQSSDECEPLEDKINSLILSSKSPDRTPVASKPVVQRECSPNRSHNDVPRQLAPKPFSPHQAGTSMTPCPQVALTPCGPTPERPLYSSCGASPKSKHKDDLLKPSVKKHFIPMEKTSTFAQKRYVAPENQAGLKLRACLGYNGNGRDNVIWQPETGFFAYTCGCVIVIEDLKSGQQRHLTGHIEEISTIAIQSDCQEMASASGTQGLTRSQLCIWDLDTMSCRKVINEHESNIVALAYSRDDRFLLSLGDYHERRINIWETSTCQLVASTLTCPSMHSVAWDPQAFNEFVIVGDNSSIMFWLIDEMTDKTPKLRVQEPQVPDEILSLAPKIDFTCTSYAGDKILYVGTNIGVIMAWETKKNTCVLHWEADKCEITCLSVRQGRLVSGSTNKCCLRLWGISGVSELALPGNNDNNSVNVEVEDEMSLDGFVTAMRFDDSLDMGIIGTDTGTLWYINWSEHSSVRLVSTNPTLINAVQFGSDGKFVTCADDGSVRIWSLEDREQILQFQVLDQQCTCASFSPSYEKSHIYGHQAPATFTLNGKRIAYSFLAAGYGDGTLRVFDTNKAEMVLKVQPHRVAVSDVTFTSASMLISGDEDGFIALTSTSTGMTVRVISDHKGAPIHNFDIANWKETDDSIHWLACSVDRRVSIWTADWSKDSCVLRDWLTFPAPAFGPDGQRSNKIGAKAYYCTLPPSIARFSTCERDMVLYTGYGLTKSVQFYDLTSKTVTRSISLTHWARNMDIAPNGSLIATGINERLLKIHDYYEGTFQDYIGNDDAVTILKFSKDGRYILSAVNKCLMLWDVLL